MRWREIVNTSRASKFYRGGFHDVSCARHGRHKGRFIRNEDVCVFIDNRYVIGNRLFWCRGAIEENILVRREDSVGRNGGGIEKHYLALCETFFQCRPIIIRMPVALGLDDLGQKIKRPNGGDIRRNAHSGGIEPIFNSKW